MYLSDGNKHTETSDHMSKHTGTYTAIGELNKAQLAAPLKNWKTLLDQVIVKAARQSIKNGNRIYYVEVTYTNIFWSTAAPSFNAGHYRVIGNKVEKYEPKFNR